MPSNTSPLRVLHLYAGNLYGGVEKILLIHASERHRCPELQPEFALCFEGRLASELRGTGVPVHMLGRVRLSRPWTTLRGRRRLTRLLRTSPPFDVVITHSAWLHAAFAPTVRRMRVPLWFWARDSYLSLNAIDYLASRTRPDHILANSKFTLAAVPLLFPGIEGDVLYNPLSPLPTMDRQTVRREVRHSLGCSESTKVIFMAARLEKWKGHKLLLDALSLIPPGDWQAWIAGGPQRPFERRFYSDLQSKTRKLGLEQKVRWLGSRSDIPSLLVAADIHCQPNTGPEPFGNVFVEALQAGLPIVTTRMGAASEIVAENCGLLIDHGDARSIAQGLEHMMVDAFRQNLSGGPARAAALCDPAQQLKQMTAVLRRFLPAPRSVQADPGAHFAE